MNVSLGSKIRELRVDSGRTQTELAEALSVSPQAVSRWEIGVTYPDLELLPSIANYFGVTIDALFGCASDREARVDEIIREAAALGRFDNGRDVNIEKRLTMLRNGLVEFPRNERLMYELAATLSNAGWARIGEQVDYDQNGFLVHTIENRDNQYWQEAIRLYESLLSETRDPKLKNDATYDLVLLYGNMGLSEKGLALAENASPLPYSRECLKEHAANGEERREYLGKALLRLADLFSDTMVQLLMSKKSNFEDDLAVRTLTGTLQLFEMLFEDGNYGPYHSRMSDLYLYLSEHQWRGGLREEAFASLEKALEHSKALDALVQDGETDPHYTAPLISGISMEKEIWKNNPSYTSCLSEDWPMWMMPESGDVRKEMTKDPRWQEWVERTKA